MSTLPRRTVAFASLFPTSCTAVADKCREDSFGMVLDRAVRIARLNHSMTPSLDHLFDNIQGQWQRLVIPES